jgi:Skp family chaperone for outer membrane proteins
MNRKKTAIIAMVVGVLVVTGAFGAGMVMAAGSTTNRKSIVERLSDRFNVSTDEVRKVFTEAQEERLQAMRDALEEKLAEAVKDGKITEAQKTTILKKEDQILAKQKELTKLQQELRDWADDNNIDLSVLGRGMGRGMGGPRGGGFGPGPGGR